MYGPGSSWRRAACGLMHRVCGTNQNERRRHQSAHTPLGEQMNSCALCNYWLTQNENECLYVQSCQVMYLTTGTNAAKRRTQASHSLFVYVVSRCITSSTSSCPAVSSPFSPPSRSYFSPAARNDLDSVGVTAYHAVQLTISRQCLKRCILHRLDSI